MRVFDTSIAMAVAANCVPGSRIRLIRAFIATEPHLVLSGARRRGSIQTDRFGDPNFEGAH
jgi:hypothetical protein